MANGFLSKFAPFPKPFWVINGVELFERGAYYGMLSVLSVFLAIDLGFPPALTGLLLAIQFPLLYFLPVVSGALADKFGFKKLLVVTFAFLIAGYLVLSVATNFLVGLAGIVLYGLGAGLFKPMPAATVTDTTSEQDRNFGFAIYYWMINLGAFVAPLGMQYVFGGSYRPYFVVSAALSVLNLVICLTLWKDIRIARPDIKVAAALKSVGDIRKHPAFMVLILIYSGFWFMYAITTSFLQIYAVDYGIISGDNIALLVPANALAILIVGPVLSKLTGKLPSLPLMIAGITIFCAGFLLIGFVPTLLALLAGVLIYSVGEFLTHPSYLAYVSKISPPDKVPIFLGYGFIAIGIGQFLGTFTGGILYGSFSDGLGQPQTFWVAIVTAGLLTVAALIVYNLVLTRRQAPRDPAAPAAARRRAAFGPAAAVGALLLIPALFAVAMLVPAAAPVETASTDPTDALGDPADLELDAIKGTAEEKKTVEQTVAIPDGATGTATFVLTWKDEAAAPASQNKPDSFKLHVKAPNGTMVAMTEAVPNGANGEGKIEVKVDGVVPGDWIIGIELDNAGDQVRGTGPLELPVGGTPDNANAWTLETTVQAAPA